MLNSNKMATVSVENRKAVAVKRSRCLLCAVAAIIVLYLLSGVYFVPTDQEAVIRFFGKVSQRAVLPGVHYRLPYPWTRCNKLKTREAKRLAVGFELADRASGAAIPSRQTEFLTGDENIVNIQMLIQYTIVDSARYLFTARDTEALMRAVSQAELTRAITNKSVDELLTTGKVELQDRLAKTIQATLDDFELGARVAAVNFQRVAPPKEVEDAFKAVIDAREDKERVVHEAYGYLNDALPKARGEAQKLIEEAGGYRQQKTDEATGDAERFKKIYVEYAKSADMTARRLYIETLEEVFAKMRKLIVTSDERSAIDLGFIKTE